MNAVAPLAHRSGRAWASDAHLPSEGPSMVARDPKSLEALFYAGAHKEVLRRTVDSPRGDYDEHHTHLVVGALVFTGRTDEASTLFRAWEREPRGATTNAGTARSAAARFFLCVAECRAGRYGAALELCEQTLATRAYRAEPLARFHLHQGLGLVRYFTGVMPSAMRHAARARRHALEARFPYGRMLALDLLGHTMVQRGRIFSGIAVLEQAAELADAIDQAAFATTTRSAIVAYRAHFGADLQDASAALHRHLGDIGDADRYSKRLILTEIARGHAFRGDREAAERELQRAEDVALPDGDRRALVKLHLARALLAGLSFGEVEAAEWLTRARPLVRAAEDPALEVDIAWYEHLVAPRLFASRADADLARMATQTGIARAAHLAAARGLEGFRASDEDRFGALLAQARAGAPAGLDGVIATRMLGLLPMCCGLEPGDRIYLDAGRGLFALESHGSVTARPFPTDAQRSLLQCLAGGPRTKEQLIREVWALKVYRPESHDAVVHTAISRLRALLGAHASWVQMSGDGYRLAPGVGVVELSVAAPRTGSTRPPPAPASVTPPAIGAPEGTSRRDAVLAMAASDAGITSTDVTKRLEISPMTALRLLNGLVEEGLLVRTGRGRKTCYQRRR